MRTALHGTIIIDKIAITSKMAKYSNLSSQHTFYTTAMETLGPLNKDVHLLLSNLGRRYQQQSFNFSIQTLTRDSIEGISVI